MAIIKQFDKRSGITYVYDSKSFYDKENIHKPAPLKKRITYVAFNQNLLV